MNVIDNINQFFIERHIHLKEDWLRSAVEYSRTQTGSDDVHPTVIYELWKYADIRESTNPCITEAIMNTNEFKGTIVLQIQAVTDIGTSYLSQFKKLVYVATDNAEFQSYDTPDNNDREKEVGSRLLQLLLSDGVRQIKAVEYKRVDELSLLVCPGSKIIVHGSVRVRREVFLLKPENCQLLGGDVDTLMRTNRPVEIMALKLHLPVPSPRPATGNNGAVQPSAHPSTGTVLSDGDHVGGLNNNITLLPSTNTRPDLATRMNSAAAIERIAAKTAPTTRIAERNATDASSGAAFAARLMSMPLPKRASQYLPPSTTTTTTNVAAVVREPLAQRTNFSIDSEKKQPTVVVDLSDYEYERVTPTRKRPATTTTNSFFASPPLRDVEPEATEFTFPTQAMGGFDHTPLGLPAPMEVSQSQQPPIATQTSRTAETVATPTTPAKDAEAHFGEYVASLLRAMSSEKRSDKRAKIFAVLNSD